MPNVPNVPGVPALTSYAAAAITLLTADVISSLSFFGAPQWGIFLDGEPVIAADNTVKFEFKQDFPVSDYPVEPNAFQSYDKVQLPAEIRVTVSCGGSVANRAAFLASIDAVMNTVDLYDVVTPEQVFTGYNFTHRDLRRSAANGVGLIAVDLWLVEIRQTTTANFTNTQQPAVAGSQNIGNVQPLTANQYVQQNFASGNWTVQ